VPRLPALSEGSRIRAERLPLETSIPQRATVPHAPCVDCARPWAKGFHLDHVRARRAGGLRPNEFTAVLHQGEAVLTKRQTEDYAAMAGSLSNMQPGVNITVNESPNARADISRDENGGVQIDVFALAEAGLADRMARGRGPLAKASRAGGRSNLRG
jgi:hypothetical protein